MGVVLEIISMLVDEIVVGNIFTDEAFDIDNAETARLAAVMQLD